VKSSKAIAVLGSGRVGSALGRLWMDAGEEVTVVASRRAARAKSAAEFMGISRSTTHYARAAQHGGWVILAVVDDALPVVVSRLAQSKIDWRGKVVLHTSGYHTADALQVLVRRGAEAGTLHPLMAVASPEEGVRRLPGAAFAVDGSRKALEVAGRLARAAGGWALRVPPDARPGYHAAAVLAANCSVALIDAAAEVMQRAGIPRRLALAAIAPLVRGSVDNVSRLGPSRGLTGPVARGDAATVQGHLQVLEGDVEEVYRCLSRRMISLANRVDPRTDRRAVAKVLGPSLPERKRR
jgi:predicted short-subunit dehydrogenase-like oxidoreductase (DUF2520 family)